MFKCAHCAYETPKVENLTDHVKKSHEKPNKPSKSFKCKFCSFNSDKYLSLTQHLAAKHKNGEAQDGLKGKSPDHASSTSSSQAAGKRILVCKYCSIFQTCDNDELVTHFKSKHFNEKNTKNQPSSNKSSGIVPCAMCSGAGYKGQLAKTNCCTKLLVECGLCSSSFKTREALSDHLNAKHTSDVKCSRCSISFPSAKSLIQHAGAKHGPRKASLFHCHLCHFVNEQHEHVLRHVLNKHCSMKLGYVCGLCDFFKNNFTDVTDHIKTNHCQDPSLCKHSVSTVEIPDKPSSSSVPNGFCCSMCEKIVPTQNSLEEHFLNTHFSNKENKVTCFICGEPAKNYCLLKIHTKESHNVDKVICECFFCNPLPETGICYVSKDTQDLLKHFKEVHDLSLSCTICEKNLTEKNLSAMAALKLKLYSPTTVVSNNCVLCKYTGKSTDALVQHHLESHSRKDVFQKCIFPNCGASFKDLNSALMHIIVEQHGRDSSALKASETKYSCIIEKCSFSYAERMKFREHLLKFHTKDVSCSFCAEGKCTLHP